MILGHQGLEMQWFLAQEASYPAPDVTRQRSRRGQSGAFSQACAQGGTGRGDERTHKTGSQSQSASPR